MQLEWTLAHTFAFGSSLLIAALGVYVGWVGRFRGINLAFMLFLMGWDLRNAIATVVGAAGFNPETEAVRGEPLVWLLHALMPVCLLVGCAGLVALLFLFPKRAIGKERWPRFAAVGAALVLAGINVSNQWQGATGSFAFLLFRVPDYVAYVFLSALQVLTALVLAGTYRTHVNDKATRSSVALFAAAIVLHPAAYMAYIWWNPAALDIIGRFVVRGTVVGIAFAAAGAWLWTGIRTSTRGPIAVAWGALLAILTGLIFWAFVDGISPTGPTRLAAVLLLSYAILRHQLFGIDVKVRWGISKTTLAGIFVAVFFVASEAAQEFFGATLENNYIGILAAGMLVFAIAPLSRFADGVAARAIPAMEEPPGSGHTTREAAYRDAVRLAVRDRKVTQGEELVLARLAEELGIGAARAMEIRHDVDKEVAQR